MFSHKLTLIFLVTKRKCIVAFKLNSVGFIVWRIIIIQKSFSNLQIAFIENVPINVSYSIQDLIFYILVQKQPSRGSLKKRCSKIMQQIYRRTLRHGFSAVNLLHIFRTPLLKSTSGRLLLLVLIAFIGIIRTVTKEMS